MGADRTHYDVLGVDRGATAAQIRRAYRQVARRLHPDVSDAPDAKARFAEAAQAYRTLSDAALRRRYDRVLAGSAAPNGRATSANGAGGANGAAPAHYTWTNIAGDACSGYGRAADFDEMYDAFFGGAAESGPNPA